MQVQKVSAYTGKYSSNKLQQSSTNSPSFGLSKQIVEGPTVLETVFGEAVAAKIRPYVGRWTKLLARKGAAPTYERIGDRLAISVSNTDQGQFLRSGDAIANVNSCFDIINALARASVDFLTARNLRTACDEVRRPVHM